MPIEYALIAEGTEALAEEPASEKNLANISRLILGKIPKHNHKRTYQEDRYNFHYKYSGTHVFLCVADREYPMRVCFAFLDDIEQRFLQGSRNLRGMLKERIAFHNDTKNDKVMRVQGQIEEVKGVMVRNIDSVLERGEKIEVLAEKSEDLSKNANLFKKQGTQLKRAMWWKNFKLQLLIIFIILLVIFVIVWIACGINFEKCKTNN